MNRELLQQALDALEFPHDSEWSNKAKAIEALQHALAQPEQEPDLPPVGIGVDVTAQGATVVGFYRRPNAVSEMFYSEFHPSPPRKETEKSELEKDAVSLLFALRDAWPYVHGHCTIESIKNSIISLIRKHGDFADLHPPRKEWVGLTEDEIFSCFAMPDMFALAHAVESKLKDKNS